MIPAPGVLMPSDLPGDWRTTARLFREHEESSVALAYEKCADALAEALREQGEQRITLSEASELSGYSADHLGRLVREGKIPNAGRPGVPRIARRDVPRKLSTVASSAATDELSREQIVRSAINEGAA